MSAKVKAFTSKRSNMYLYSKRGTLYVGFSIDEKKKQRSLRMKDTPQNRKIATKEIIPKLQAKIALGEYGQSEKIPKTFKYYADIFLDEKKETQRSFKNKVYTYRKAIALFENFNVKDITRLEVKQEIRKLKVNSDTKKDYLAVIKDILELAVDDQEIKHNVAVGITLPRESKSSKIDYFEKSEVAKLLEDYEDMELNLYLQVAFTTGMRPEEILALKKTDISNGFVKIQRTKTRANGISEILKTDSSKRTIPFSVDISHLTSKSFFLFPNINHIDHLRLRWKRLLERNNIRHRGISNCRHTVATHILKDGIMEISELSGLLGHSKVSTTLTFYASVIDSHSFELKDKMKNLSYHKLTLDNDNKKISFG